MLSPLPTTDHSLQTLKLLLWLMNWSEPYTQLVIFSNHPSIMYLPGAGLDPSSILSSWLFTIKDQCNKVRFSQARIQGLRKLFSMLS